MPRSSFSACANCGGQCALSEERLVGDQAFCTGGTLWVM